LVILSHHFFAKNWPKYELAGLKARQLRGEQVIIPIWHQITIDDVIKFSPPLADMLACDTGRESLEQVSEKILAILKPNTHSQWLVSVMRSALKGLGRAKYHGTDYDYWPYGGLKNLYYRAINFATYPQLVTYFGRSIWLTGPHTNAELDLSNPTDFGHYDPEFVTWLRSNLRFVLQRPEFVRSTRRAFEKYLLNLALLYYAAYEFLRVNPSVKARLIQDYVQRTSEKTIEPQYYWALSWIDDLPKDDPITIMMKRLDERFDSNRASSAIYFWVRRSIDGTSDLFFSILADALSTYSSASLVNMNTFTLWNVETGQ
jgi:hypothetical protein